MSRSTPSKRTAQPHPLPSKPSATATPTTSPAATTPQPPARGMSQADAAMAAALNFSQEADAGSDESDREDRRDSVVDRRSGIDRRDAQAVLGRSKGADASLSTNLERRRGPGRRRTDFMKCADEGEMTQEQFLFIMAIDAFKRVNGKTFPTWTDVLEVVRKLGYRKTMPSELNLGKNTEDWCEPPNAPAGVFKEAEED